MRENAIVSDIEQSCYVKSDIQNFDNYISENVSIGSDSSDNSDKDGSDCDSCHKHLLQGWNVRIIPGTIHLQ